MTELVFSDTLDGICGVEPEYPAETAFPIEMNVPIGTVYFNSS